MIDRLAYVPLRNPAFRRYFAGRSFSYLGDGLIPIALVFGAIRLGASPAQVGFVLLAGRLPVVVFTLVGGVVGDVVPRRVVMVVADIVRCVTQALTAVLLLTGVGALWQIGLLQAVAGTATAFFNPAATGLVADVVAEKDLQHANALLTTTQNAATLIAPVLSASVVGVVGAGASFALDAVTFVVSAVALLLLRVPDRRSLFRPGLLSAGRYGWNDFRSRPWLHATTVQVAVINGVCISPFLVLGPIVAHERLGGALSWAFVGNGYAVGALVGSAIATRWRPRFPLRVAVTIPVALVPLMALLATNAPVPVLAVAAVPAGMQSALYAVLTETARQIHVPRELVARATSFSSVVGLAAAPLGMALAGPAAEQIGISAVLVIAAIVALVSAPLALLVRSVRTLPAEPETPTSAPEPEPALPDCEKLPTDAAEVVRSDL